MTTDPGADIKGLEAELRDIENGPRGEGPRTYYWKDKPHRELWRAVEIAHTAIAERDEARAALAESDKHAEKIEALLEPHISWEGRPSMFAAQLADEMSRPIIGIENRTAREVFDIMRDRARAFIQPTGGTDGR